jgi:hypothetical protein
MPVQDDLDGIIENAIVRFLRGAPAGFELLPGVALDNDPCPDPGETSPHKSATRKLAPGRKVDVSDT